jgi:hypothetical protein
MVNGLQQYQDWRTAVPAAIEPGSGVESASGALDPTNIATTSVYIEYVAGVLLSFQIVYGQRVFEIISTSNLAEADLFLLMVCREVQV